MKEVRDLVSNWEFVRSPGLYGLRSRRVWRRHIRARPRPPHEVLKPVAPAHRWIVYFVFAPTGRVSASHVFTLEKLRLETAKLLIICASPASDQIPAELHRAADALFWKGLSGYDFSAYSLALRAIATHSPRADVFFLNDSVLGPFGSLDACVDAAMWDVTGITSSSLVENHLQSYAFIVKTVTSERVEKLKKAFPEDIAYDRAGDAILCQETYFGRLASYTMKVGSFWHAPTIKVPDPTLLKPLELLDAGSPFLKRSLFGKHVKFQQNAQDALISRLQREQHPLDFRA